MIKDWRRPAAVPLRLAILFGLSAIIGDTATTLSIDIRKRDDIDLPTPKVLGFPTDLEAVSL